LLGTVPCETDVYTFGYLFLVSCVTAIFKLLIDSVFSIIILFFKTKV